MNKRIIARELGVLGALAIMCIAFGISSPVFFSMKNIINVLRQISLLGIVSIGMTLVIVCKEIDLSVGSIYGLAAMVSGLLMVNGLGIPLSILGGVIIGTGVGTINGIVSTFGKIPSFITTLGMLNVARGLGLLMSGGMPVTLNESTIPGSHLQGYLFWGQGRIGNFLPPTVLIFGGVAILGYLFLHKTQIGFHMRAVGGNWAAAKAAGISVNSNKIVAFGILGFLSSISGVLNMADVASVQGTTGQTLELDVIATVLIGGTSLNGGEGTIIGTFIGALIVGVLRNGLVLAGVSPFWQVIVIGLVIIGAVGMDMWFRNKERYD